MLAVLVTLKVADGKAEEMEDAFRWAQDQVKANEPGNLLYRVSRSQEDPSSYYIFELFQDQDAFMAHRNSEHAREMHLRTKDLFQVPPKLEFCNCI